jgi:hypothetical protein
LREACHFLTAGRFYCYAVVAYLDQVEKQTEYLQSSHGLSLCDLGEDKGEGVGEKKQCDLHDTQEGEAVIDNVNALEPITLQKRLVSTLLETTEINGL